MSFVPAARTDAMASNDNKLATRSMYEYVARLAQSARSAKGLYELRAIAVNAIEGDPRISDADRNELLHMCHLLDHGIQHLLDTCKKVDDRCEERIKEISVEEKGSKQ